MDFIWDAANIGHIARHDISPDEAEQIFFNRPFDLERQFRGGEHRRIHLGETDAGRVLIVVITLRDEMVRVVTAHPADRSARRLYTHLKGTRDG